MIASARWFPALIADFGAAELLIVMRLQTEEALCTSSTTAMVTMNSDKVTAKRKPEASIGCASNSSIDEPGTLANQLQPQLQTNASEDSPNLLLYKKVTFI